MINQPLNFGWYGSLLLISSNNQSLLLCRQTRLIGRPTHQVTSECTRLTIVVNLATLSLYLVTIETKKKKKNGTSQSQNFQQSTIFPTNWNQCTHNIHALSISKEFLKYVSKYSRQEFKVTYFKLEISLVSQFKVNI